MKNLRLYIATLAVTAGAVALAAGSCPSPTPPSNKRLVASGTYKDDCKAAGATFETRLNVDGSASGVTTVDPNMCNFPAKGADNNPWDKANAQVKVDIDVCVCADDAKQCYDPTAKACKDRTTPPPPPPPPPSAKCGDTGNEKDQPTCEAALGGGKCFFVQTGDAPLKTNHCLTLDICSNYKEGAGFSAELAQKACETDVGFCKWDGGTKTCGPAGVCQLFANAADAAVDCTSGVNATTPPTQPECGGTGASKFAIYRYYCEWDGSVCKAASTPAPNDCPDPKLARTSQVECSKADPLDHCEWK